MTISEIISKIPSKQVTVYDWNDLRTALCEVMGIPEDKFRDYHEIVGGEYKDFWHVCLDVIIPDSMSNGNIVTMFRGDEEWFDDEPDSEWKILVIKAWNTIYDQLDTSGTDGGIEVHFSW